MSRRDGYADVGRAMRQAIDRALVARLGTRQWRVFVAVLRQTGTYSKLSDRLYLAALADFVFNTEEPSTWQIKRIGADLAALADAGIIEREPPKTGRPPAGGPRYVVAIPKGAETSALSSAKGSSSSAEREQLARVKGTQNGGPTEKYSEKTPSAADSVRLDGNAATAPHCTVCHDLPINPPCPEPVHQERTDQ